VSRLGREFRPMLRLAAPLAAAELAWMAMGVVDTIMLGPLGPAAIGAGSLGSMVLYTVATSGTGLLLGMDTLVAQAFGAGDLADARRSLVNGLWLSLLLVPPVMAACMTTLPVLAWFGINPRVFAQFSDFLPPLVWSVAPLFLYATLRRYLQAVNVVKPLTFAMVTANLVNFVGNWVLIYGHWGAPAMGIRGSGWSTCIARVYMAAVLLATVVRHGGFRGAVWRPAWARVRHLFTLGLPAAVQVGLEAAVFALVTVFAGKLDEASLAAHGIALNVISVTYMVPLGISAAAAVRVGNAVGRGDRRGAAASGSAALLLSAAFMSAAAVVLFTVPESVIRIYTGDPRVVHVGVTMLAIAAFFELGDGTQVVATGALRGLGDTRTPMLANLAWYWGVGVPVSWWFCFHLGWGAPGLWLGLCVALLLIGGTLLAAWRKRVRAALPLRLQNDHVTLP
jgi:multidrug resistance protein, MATE family